MASSNGGKRSSLYADLDHLQSMFASVDPENTGYICQHELWLLAQSDSGMDEQMVSIVLERLDRDKDGKISFDDFQALFELERESIKKQRLQNMSEMSENTSAMESSPGENITSLQSDGGSEVPAVVLRRRKPPKLGSVGRVWASDPGVPIPLCSSGGKSPVEHAGVKDIATQMRYLTSIPESPRISRGSKVLSWISESEDMFEDTGNSEEHAEALLSPPMSPKRVSGDEAAHAHSVVEAVCQSQEIGPEAVEKLCSHVQADQQEQQELLVLLNHLDKEGKGHVSIDEFVDGLHSMRSTLLPRRSEPFSSTPTSSQRKLAHHSSILQPPQWKSVTGDMSQLSVLDPENMGFVGVEELAQQWQTMGVEAPHNTSLEDVLKESLPVDSSQRVSVAEVSSCMETAILNENQNSILRQAALLTFKGEINQLRTQMHQVSVERDGLQSALQRTMEESRRLVLEGDEQVEKITRESERRAWENEQRVTERVREVERQKEEEAKRLQELIDLQKERYQKEISNLRYSEERLKRELKFALDEAKRNVDEKKHVEEDKHDDWPEKVEIELSQSYGMKLKLEELEQENSELLEQNKVLREQNRSFQDRVDELVADNEKVKQKHTFHQRRLQRQSSTPHFPGMGDNRPHSGKRPSSAKRRSTTMPTLDLISEAPMDKQGSHNSDSDTYSPALALESLIKGEVEDLPPEALNEELEADREGSDILTTSSDEGLFAKSTTSLLDEMQQEDTKTLLERELEELRLEKQETEENCYLLEQQLQQQRNTSDSEKKRLLWQYRRKQEMLKKQIQSLEEQKKRLSSAKEGIENQLENLEVNLGKQLCDIHKLRDKLSNTEMGDSDPQSKSLAPVLVGDPELLASADEVSEEEERSHGYQEEVRDLQHKLEVALAEQQQLMIDHNEALQRIQSDTQDEMQKLIASGKEQNEAILRLKKELHSSQLALEQYKSDAQSLEVQLQLLQHEIKAKERELQLVQGRPFKRFATVPSNVALENEELAKLRDEKKNMQKNIEVKLAEAEELHLHQLQDQEATYKAQLEMRAQIHHKELARVREDAMCEITALKATMSKEHASNMCFEIQLANVQKELNESHLVVKSLTSRLEMAEKHFEHLQLTVSKQREVKEAMIEDLEATHPQSDTEMSSAERERQEPKEQIQLHTELEEMQSKVTDTMPMVAVEEATEGSNYQLSTEVMPSSVMPPMVQSCQSGFHEEIVSQMKEQLQDLQVCLVQQTNTSDKNELTLVKELLNTIQALEVSLEREQDRSIKELETLEEEKSKALTERDISFSVERAHFYHAVLENLKEAVQFLVQRSESSICSCVKKIEEASKALAHITESMKKAAKADTTQVDQPEFDVLRQREQSLQRANVSEREQKEFGNESDVKRSELRPTECKSDSELDDQTQEDAVCEIVHSVTAERNTAEYETEEVDTPVHAGVQYMEMKPQEAQSDAVHLHLVHDHLDAAAELDTVQDELDDSSRESVELRQQVFALKQAVQEQEAELRVEMAKMETERRESQVKIQQLGLQLHSATSEVELLKSKLHDVCSQLTPRACDPLQVDNDELTQRAKDEIANLRRQLSDEQTLRCEVEMSIGASQTEWQLQETQWLAEHEEEVRALKQRNSHLEQMLEDMRSQYQEYIAEQERQNSETLQDLMAKQANLENEIEMRTEQLSEISFQSDGHSEHKVALLDIIEELCMLFPTT